MDFDGGHYANEQRTHSLVPPIRECAKSAQTTQTDFPDDFPLNCMPRKYLKQ